MKKEKEIPSFDDLKNPDYEYHYSRAERIARRRKKNYFEETYPRKKGILGYISGGNPQVSNFIVFYIFLALIFWIFAYLKNPSRLTEKRVFNYEKGKKVEISFVEKGDFRGLNLLLLNNDDSNWKIGKIIISNKVKFIETNLNITVSSKNFEAIFIEDKEILSDKKIFVEVK